MLGLLGPGGQDGDQAGSFFRCPIREARKDSMLGRVPIFLRIFLLSYLMPGSSKFAFARDLDFGYLYWRIIPLPDQRPS